MFWFKTYTTVAAVPPKILEQLKRQCYTTKLGFMRSILDHPNIFLKRYITVMGLQDDVIGWAVIGPALKNKKGAHVWVDRKYRRNGYAAQILGHLLQKLPTQHKNIGMVSKQAQPLMDIGRYLYLNNLLLPC